MELAQRPTKIARDAKPLFTVQSFVDQQALLATHQIIDAVDTLLQSRQST